jgi:hypothetical protein
MFSHWILATEVTAVLIIFLVFTTGFFYQFLYQGMILVLFPICFPHIVNSDAVRDLNTGLSDSAVPWERCDAAAVKVSNTILG